MKRVTSKSDARRPEMTTVSRQVCSGGPLRDGHEMVGAHLLDVLDPTCVAIRSRRHPMRLTLLSFVLGLAACGALAPAPSEAQTHWRARSVAVGYYAPAYYYTPAYYYAPPVAYRSYYVAPTYYPASTSAYVMTSYYTPVYTSAYVAPTYASTYVAPIYNPTYASSYEAPTYTSFYAAPTYYPAYASSYAAPTVSPAYASFYVAPTYKNGGRYARYGWWGGYYR
jgi:hypothetical protein